MADSHAAFRRHFDDHYGPLVRFLRAQTRDPALAQDLAQEAFLRLWWKRPAGLGRDSVRFWLFRVARNLALNELARRSRWGRLLPALARLTRAPEPNAERQRIEAEQGGRLLELAARLPASQRDALLLRELEGMRYAEIAQTLGVSLAKVKSDIHRARLALRRRWRESQRQRPDDAVEPRGEQDGL